MRNNPRKVDIPDYGFIAQELDAVQSKHNAEWLNLVLKNNPDRLEANWGKLLPILIRGWQEQQTQIESQQTVIESQQTQIDELKAQIAQILSKLA